MDLKLKSSSLGGGKRNPNKILILILLFYYVPDALPSYNPHDNNMRRVLNENISTSTLQMKKLTWVK